MDLPGPPPPATTASQNQWNLVLETSAALIVPFAFTSQRSLRLGHGNFVKSIERYTCQTVEYDGLRLIRRWHVSRIDVSPWRAPSESFFQAIFSPFPGRMDVVIRTLTPGASLGRGRK